MRTAAIVLVSILSINASAQQAQPTHADVSVLLQKAERCEASEQFREEAALLATCAGQPGEDAVHAALVPMLTDAIGRCPIPEKIPDAASSKDVLDLLEAAHARTSDVFLASIVALLKKHAGKSTEPTVLPQVRASFNQWLASHPDVRLQVQGRRERTVMNRAQAKAILDRTRGEIASNPILKVWYDKFLADTGRAIDALIAQASKITADEAAVAGRDDPFEAIFWGYSRVDSYDFANRREQYLANARRFRRELDNYLTALIAAANGTANKDVTARLARLTVPPFRLVYSGEGGVMGEVRSKVNVEGEFVRHTEQIVRMDVSDTHTYGYFADTITHEAAHALLQNDRSRIVDYGFPDVETKFAMREFVLEGVTQHLTARMRTILAAYHEEERKRSAGDEAGVYAYRPLVALAALMSVLIGEDTVLAWYVGGLETVEFGHRVDGALKSTLGITDDVQRSRFLAALFSSERNEALMEVALLHGIDAFEGVGRRLSDESRGLAFMNDDTIAYIASFESLNAAEESVPSDDRWKALWLRVRVGYYANMSSATLVTLVAYIAALPEEKYAAFAGREAKPMETTVHTLLTDAKRRDPENPEIAVAYAKAWLDMNRAQYRSIDWAADMSHTTSSGRISAREAREVLADVERAVERDPKSFYGWLIRSRVVMFLWDREAPQYAVEVATCLSTAIRLAHNKEEVQTIVAALRDVIKYGTVWLFFPDPKRESYLLFFEREVWNPYDTIRDLAFKPLEDAKLIQSAAEWASALRDRSADLYRILEYAARERLKQLGQTPAQ